jgi:hypothetical protein
MAELEQNAYTYRGYLIIDSNKKGSERFEIYESYPTIRGRGWGRCDSAESPDNAKWVVDQILEHNRNRKRSK